MSALSNEFRDVALELCELFGKDYVIRRPVKMVPDVTRPTYVETTYQEYPCKAALTSFSEEQIKMLQVLRTDLQAVVAWNSSLPDKIVPGDEFVDGSMVYTIVPPETVLTVNGETVAWQLIVRK